MSRHILGIQATVVALLRGSTLAFWLLLAFLKFFNLVLDYFDAVESAPIFLIQEAVVDLLGNLSTWSGIDSLYQAIKCVQDMYQC